MLADQWQLRRSLLEPLLGGRIVVDLFAPPLEAAAAEHDLGAAQREVASDLPLERLELVRVDDQREIADPCVGVAHDCRRARWLCSAPSRSSHSWPTTVRR